jgi:hypothetical protein
MYMFYISTCLVIFFHRCKNCICLVQHPTRRCKPFVCPGTGGEVPTTPPPNSRKRASLSLLSLSSKLDECIVLITQARGSVFDNHSYQGRPFKMIHQRLRAALCQHPEWRSSIVDTGHPRMMRFLVLLLLLTAATSCAHHCHLFSYLVYCYVGVQSRLRHQGQAVAAPLRSSHREQC